MHTYTCVPPSVVGRRSCDKAGTKSITNEFKPCVYRVVSMSIKFMVISVTYIEERENDYANAYLYKQFGYTTLPAA